MNIKYFVLLILVLVVNACAVGKKTVNVDDFFEVKNSFENKGVSITGLLVQKKDGAYLCSEDRAEDQLCINLEYKSVLKKIINDLTGKRVLLYGTYMPHEFQDGGLSLVPSRIHVINLEDMQNEIDRISID